MDEDRSRELEKWYGVTPGGRPAGYPGERLAQPGGEGQALLSRGRRRERTLAALTAAALIALLIAVIAMSASLFRVTEPAGPSGVEGYPADYRDYFADYYDASAPAASEPNKLPAAETGTGVTVTLSPRPEGEAMSLSEVYAKCSESVAAITSEREDGAYLWGSGIIMTADGYILTNAHMLEGAVSATVTLWDDREYEAGLVGVDSPSDLAVLKIEAVGLPAAEFAAETPSVGEAVTAIGNPLGPELRGTMTDGIISALSRDITYTGHPMTLIQTNAAINEGNSGGALFNMYGQVVGMTSMKLVGAYAGSSIEGIGFAIPAETMKAVADELIASGMVRGRPALGVTVGAIPAAAAEHYGIPAGLYISSVAPGSDAEAKGLRAGDIIVSAEGENTGSTEALTEAIADKGVGQAVSLRVYRYGGETLYIDVLLMDRAELY